MKLVLIAATAALMISASAQDTKVAAAAPLKISNPDRPLNETEVLKLQLSMANVQLLQDRYKISEYQKEVQPLAEEQERIVTEACKSIGIPAEKVKTECGLTTGIGQDGKPLMGADGKPIQARVWWNKPAESK